MENTDIKVFELEEYLEIVKLFDESDESLSEGIDSAEFDELKKQFSIELMVEQAEQKTEE